MDNELLYAQVGQIVKQHLASAESCHDLDHTLRVCRNADKLLAELPEADKNIVRLAALLHDIARPEEKADGSVCHAERGACLTEEILRKLGADPVLVSRVSAAVRTHRYRDDNAPASLEAKIVYDADKLDSLGAVGVGRAFLFAGKFGARLHNTAEEALSHKAYSREDTAYREYLVKLRHLPEAVLTEPGRRIAQERIVFMETFFAELDAETDLDSK
ncbi:MAG: HD domain-containing protein [Lentisphaeria bacterium]|nr:HD domain-containing protein [Lentisphaeria bacterium]